MPPYPNTFAPSKKTRDFSMSDTVIAFSNTRPEVVAAGTTIAPDTLVLLTAINPDTVAEALTGTPVIGTDTVYGTSATYSNNTSVLAGLCGITKHLPGMTYRVRVDATYAALMIDQTFVDGIIGNQYVLLTTTDADGFIHQVLDVTGGASITYMLKVVDGDFNSKTVEVEIVG